MFDHDFSHGDSDDDRPFARSHEAMRAASEAVAIATSRRLVEWAERPVAVWRGRTTEVLKLVEAARHGMSVLPNLAAALTVMYDPATYRPVDDDEEAHRAHEVEEVAKSAERAASEVKRGFPLLHYLACVWLWVSVEALLEDLVLGALRSDPAMADQEVLRDVRVPWTVAASDDPEAMARAVYREFEAKRGATLKSGVTRFEGLLSAVGLGGEVPDVLRRELFELGQIRNAILHRGGRADAALIEQCPWLNLTPGDELRVSREKFERDLLERDLLVVGNLFAHQRTFVIIGLLAPPRPQVDGRYIQEALDLMGQQRPVASSGVRLEAEQADALAIGEGQEALQLFPDEA